MATKKQIEANRRNAKKSTGPKSKKGRQSACNNSTKHGLTARRITVGDEDRGEYEAFRDDLLEFLWPASPLEKLLANQVAESAWRLRRVREIEYQMWQAAFVYNQMTITPDEDTAMFHAFEHQQYNIKLLHRYEATIERSMYKALNQLRIAKVDRKKENLEKAEYQRALQNYLTDKSSRAAWEKTKESRGGKHDD